MWSKNDDEHFVDICEIHKVQYVDGKQQHDRFQQILLTWLSKENSKSSG